MGEKIAEHYFELRTSNMRSPLYASLMTHGIEIVTFFKLSNANNSGVC